MAICVAVIGKENSPKFIACLKEEQELQFHYKVHTSLDIVEEKLSSPGKVSGDLRELYLGLLYSTEEQKIFLEEVVGFQPPQEQNIADKCISVRSCDHTAKYESINSTCKNFRFPMWGEPSSTLVRLWPDKYQDDGFGYVTNTKIKFIIVVDSANSMLRDNEIRTMFRKLHSAYTDVVCNPFHIPGDKIESKKFDAVVRAILQGN